MSELIDFLSSLNTSELNKEIEKDKEGEMGFELESELMGRLNAICFPNSPTFGELEEETDPERCVRVLIESLGIPETLAAILAIDTEFEEMEENDLEGDNEEDTTSTSDKRDRKAMYDDDDDAGFYDDMDS